jgi:2,3-dihydroxybenzoate-AMP ligase
VAHFALCDFLLAQNIAKFKLSERSELFAEFPISGAGKILRRTLREVVVSLINTPTV